MSFRYSFDPTDAEQKQIESISGRFSLDGHDLRGLVNTVFYIPKTGLLVANAVLRVLIVADCGLLSSEVTAAELLSAALWLDLARRPCIRRLGSKPQWRGG